MPRKKKARKERQQPQNPCEIRKINRMLKKLRDCDASLPIVQPTRKWHTKDRSRNGYRWQRRCRRTRLSKDSYWMKYPVFSRRPDGICTVQCRCACADVCCVVS